MNLLLVVINTTSMSSTFLYAQSTSHNIYESLNFEQPPQEIANEFVEILIEESLSGDELDIIEFTKNFQNSDVFESLKSSGVNITHIENAFLSKPLIVELGISNYLTNAIQNPNDITTDALTQIIKLNEEKQQEGKSTFENIITGLLTAIVVGWLFTR